MRLEPKMLTSVPVDNESKGIARRFLADASEYETVSQKYFNAASRFKSDFANKGPKGAIRAADAAARMLPASVRKPWFLDIDNRAVAWRFLARSRRGPMLRAYEADGEGHDFALHEHQSVGMAVLAMLNDDIHLGPSYTVVTMHALGRLCQRGGARTNDAITKAVLALHNDIGRMPTSEAVELLSRPEGQVLWFPSTHGAWALETLKVYTETNSGVSDEEFRLVARTWLSRDELMGDQEFQVDRVRNGFLSSIGDPNAAASMDGPLSVFSVIRGARRRPMPIFSRSRP